MAHKLVATRTRYTANFKSKTRMFKHAVMPAAVTLHYKLTFSSRYTVITNTSCLFNNPCWVWCVCNKLDFQLPFSPFLFFFFRRIVSSFNFASRQFTSGIIVFQNFRIYFVCMNFATFRIISLNHPIDFGFSSLFSIQFST